MSRAPEFADGVRWFLRHGALQLHGQLRGHVTAVLLWRCGCVHCVHALADLQALSAHFAGRPFAAVAVHTPSVAAEDDTARVLRAARPAPDVVVGFDRLRSTWSLYGAAGYPTLALVDSTGELRYCGRGEPNAVRLRDAIDGLLVEGQARAALAVLPFAPPPAVLPASATGLCQPQALCAFAGQLWLADTGNRRLVACTLDGQVERTFGSGRDAADDGDAASCSFRWPVGLAVAKGRLHVADAGAHSLRSVDAGGEVATVCGTGTRAADRFGGGFGAMQGLCSPRGLVPLDGGLVIANAGTHQLWQFDPDTTAATAWLGNGQPLLRDGSGEAAALQQPSGLAVTDGVLWIADTGNGALRSVDLAHSWVRTATTELPRPIAVAVHQGVPIVADAWLGGVYAVRSGQAPALLAGSAQGLVEPAGLCVIGDRLLIADAGADALFELDLAAASPMATCKPFVLRGLPPALASASVAPVLLPLATLRTFADVALDLRLPLASGESVAADAVAAVRVANDEGNVLSVGRNATAVVADGRVRIGNLATGEAGRGALRLQIDVDVATANGPARRTFRFTLPVRAASDGVAELQIG